MSDSDGTESNKIEMRSLVVDQHHSSEMECLPIQVNGYHSDLISDYNAVVNAIARLETSMRSSGDLKDPDLADSLTMRISKIELGMEKYLAKKDKLIPPQDGSAPQSPPASWSDNMTLLPIAVDKTAVDDGVAGLDEHGQPVYKLEHYFKLPVWRVLLSRLPWLMGLLILQSFSAAILDGFPIIEEHYVIALFVPTLVGSGGNAGNQPGVMVTRALANRELQGPAVTKLLRRELVVATCTALIMGSLGFCRVLVTHPHVLSAACIGIALCLVVFTSIFLGIGFSIMLDRCGVDPAAGAAPLLTTIADLVGITLLCLVAVLVFGG
jgi:cation transporter-like permease